MANKYLKRKALLAAPIVATAILTPACEGRVYRNPMPPQQPQPPETAPTNEITPTNPPRPTNEPTKEPMKEPTSEPTASPESLPDPPVDGGGRVEKQADGTCLYVFPPPKPMSCPPTATCNPGPPRTPIRVKCPDGGSS